MHFWVRTLVVPGRGAPVFVLHDEYGSWIEMLRILVGNFARNGQPQLTMAEVGMARDVHQREMLAAFPGLQYMGVFIDEEDAPMQDRENRYAAYMRLKDDLKEFAGRVVVHYTTSLALASAIPPRALDMAFLDVGSSSGNIEQELERWEARVKPGGILAGRGFGPAWPEAVRAVCARRFSNDIHLGAGGGFWWFVEPDEEE